MDFAAILLILGAVALVLGPVMMFRPSPRDRQLAALRGHANRQGIRVALAAGGIAELKGSARYAMPWAHKLLKAQRWSLVRKSYQHGLHLAGYWAWQGDAAPAPLIPLLEGFVARLPDSVVALSAGPEGLSVNWREQGGLAVLQSLLSDLAELQQQLHQTESRSSMSSS